MSRYFCPYCSSRNQLHKTRSDGVLICGLCGDPLEKKSIINSKGIVGVVVFIAFLAPLLIMISSLLTDFTYEKLHNDSQSDFL